jgi:hypothetical protein
MFKLAPVAGVCAAMLVVTVCTSAWGQDEQQRIDQVLRDAERDYALKANPDLSIGERALLNYGVLVNFSFLAIDDVDQRTHLLRQTDLQAYARLSLDGVHEFYGRARFVYRDFNNGDSFDGDGDEAVIPMYDRLWYRFDLRQAVAAYEGRNIADNFTVKIGRQFSTWAGGLAFSEDLYAVDAKVELAGPDIELRGLVGLTPSNSVIDLDSSRPSYDEDTQRLFAGGQVSYTGWHKHTPYFFVLNQVDLNSRNPATLAPNPPGYPTTFGYNSTYWGVGATGELFNPHWRYAAEFVYETGRTRSTSYTQPGLVPAAQTNNDIEAWAARFYTRYLFQDEQESQAIFEALFASGDPDRDTDTTNTFGGSAIGDTDRAFNSIDGVGTGLAFGPPVSNLMMFRGGFSSFPFKSVKLFERLRLGLDVYVFNKMDSAAPLDEASGNASYLGTETDLSADWRIFSDLSVHLRYGVFFPGNALNSDSDERHFLYTGITYSF